MEFCALYLVVYFLWQYWVLPLEAGKSFKVHEMPLKYRKEMLADWYGASKAQKTSGIDKWWEVNKNKLVLGKETYIWFDWMVNCPIGKGSCTRREGNVETKSK